MPLTPGFPLEVWSNQASDNKSGLSFGPDSSFIDWLYRADLVPSKAFGVFFGSRSQLNATDGNITIGGYDRARFQGDFTKFTIAAGYLDSPCPLQVEVKDIA